MLLEIDILVRHRNAVYNATFLLASCWLEPAWNFFIKFPAKYGW
jgi:hypothetical protein